MSGIIVPDPNSTVGQLKKTVRGHWLWAWDPVPLPCPIPVGNNLATFGPMIRTSLCLTYLYEVSMFSLSRGGHLRSFAGVVSRCTIVVLLILIPAYFVFTLAVPVFKAFAEIASCLFWGVVYLILTYIAIATFFSCIRAQHQIRR